MLCVYRVIDTMDCANQLTVCTYTSQVILIVYYTYVYYDDYSVYPLLYWATHFASVRKFFLFHRSN